jgi:hypothetical protein
MSDGNIFISFRRQDAPGNAGRIYDRLDAHFPGSVFMDVVGIGVGTIFDVEISRQVEACRVFIALIGDEWATSTDRTGRRRLDDPEDFVRLEVAAALRRRTVIIPVLVNGAAMPDKATLPEDIAQLTRYHALEITQTDFNHGVERLIFALEKILARTPEPKPSSVPEPSPVPVPEPSPVPVTEPSPVPEPSPLPSPEPAPVPSPLPEPLPAPRPAPKPDRLRLVLKIAIGVVGLLIVGAIGWFVLLPKLSDKTNPAEPANANNVARNGNNNSANVKPDNVKEIKPTPEPFIPPANTARFANSREGLDGKLAEHYVDFSFYYPKNWVPDPTAGKAGATNFAKVDRFLSADLTQENFAVGWYASSGSPAAEFPQLVKNLSARFEKGFTEYRKVSEGPTKVNSLDAYEFRFASMYRNTANGDIKVWGRAIFLPPQDGGPNGVTLVMLATSLAPEIRSENDVGVKGQTPLILKSFRFGPPPS